MATQGFLQESPPIIVCGASNLIRKPPPSTAPSPQQNTPLPSPPSSTTPSPSTLASPSLLPLNSLAEEASRLAPLIRASLAALSRIAFNPSAPYTPEDILRLPLLDPAFRPPPELLHLPRRKSRRMPLAAAVAGLVFPSHAGSLAPLIRYEEERVRLRAWGVVAAEFERIGGVGGIGRFGAGGGAAPGVGVEAWGGRILEQGLWDGEMVPVSLGGVSTTEETGVLADGDVAPLLEYLEGGRHSQSGDLPSGAVPLNGGAGEPRYGVKGLEFPRGILLEDGRLDLYKTGIGAHVEPLMQSLRSDTSVRHIQLGSNALGRPGCVAIARYLEDVPGRIETWYLGGNDIDADGFSLISRAIVKSKSVSSLYLKGNPLGPESVPGLCRLITEMENLRILDLDETRLGDEGVALLFETLVGATGTIPLEALYLSGNGMSTRAAEALSKLLSQTQCAHNLHSIYLSYNPLGDLGAKALSQALQSATQLRRLTLQSVGLGTEGASALAHSLRGHPSLRVLDLSQGHATVRLGQAFNYIEDGALDSLRKLVESTTGLEALHLGHSALTPTVLSRLRDAVAESSSLLSFSAMSVYATGAGVQGRSFVPAQVSTHAHASSGGVLTGELGEENAAGRRVEGNAMERFGVKYGEWMEAEGRWVVVDEGIRGVDSVYQGRDWRALERDISFFIG